MTRSRRRKTVDLLIEKLAGEGRRIEDGEFTLDRERARQQMQQFQLAQPRSYVLELVQAAVLKGATRIAFNIDADDMRMKFNGRPFTLHEFSELYKHLFSSDEDPDNEACRQLAVALNAAQSLRPRYIKITSGDGDDAAHLTMERGKPDQYEVVQDRVAGTTVHVKSGMGPRLLLRFVLNVARRLPEERFLMQRCRFARTDIDLDDQRISHGHEPPDTQCIVGIYEEAVRGRGGFRFDTLQGILPMGMVHLVKNDVLIASHTFTTPTPGFVAVVEGRRLKKDLSQRDIVRNEAYDDVMEKVHTARTRSLIRVCTQRINLTHRKRVDALIRKAICEQKPDAFLHADPDDTGAHPELSRKLATARVWTVGPPKSEALHAVWGSAEDDVFVTGSRGVILHYNGRFWHTMASGVTADLNGVWGCAQDCVIAVGDGGTVLHYDGTRWIQQDAPTYVNLNAVWGDSPSSVIAVGNNGMVLKFDGRHWKREESLLVRHNLYTVWGSSHRDVHIGGKRTLLHYDGHEWNDLRWAGSIYALWGNSSTDAFATHSSGRAYHFNGNGWYPLSIRTGGGLAADLKALWCCASDAWAAGEAGVIAHRLRGQWTTVQPPPRYTLKGVWGSSPTNVIVVGDQGTVLVYNGTEWHPVTTSIKDILGKITEGDAEATEGQPARTFCVRTENPAEEEFFEHFLEVASPSPRI